MAGIAQRWMGYLFVILSFIIFALPGAANAQGEQAPLKEIQLAAGAFERGSAPPAWAHMAPVPPMDPGGKPIVQLLADLHLRVAPIRAFLSNRVIQVNDAGLLGELGQVSVNFNPAYQRLSIHKVEVLRAGVVLDLTGSVPVRFLQRESGLERGVYSGVITASMVLPDVRVGDALHLVYSVEGSNPIMGSLYSEAASWDDQRPVRLRRVTLIAPQDRNIAWRLVGGKTAGTLEPRIQLTSGERRTVFEGQDFPAVELEPSMPRYARPLRWLQFSEFSDWNQVALWAGELFRVPAQLPAVLEPLMAKLRALTDDEARASEALQWVQGNVRYYSVSLGESSHRPSPPSVVLGNRYGDCKDKSLLLVSILRAVGMEADVALTASTTGRPISGLLPAPDVFDHAVVRVRLGDKFAYLDPTRTGQVGSVFRMGQQLEDFEVLLARSDSQGAEVVKSALRSDTFRGSVSERFEAETFEGEAQLQVELVLNGLSAEYYREAWPRMDATARGQWALNGYDKRYPGIETVSGPELNDRPSENHLRIVTRYRIPKLIREVEGDFVMNFSAPSLQGALLIPERISREFPVVVPTYPSIREYQVQMRWPESVAVIRDPVLRTIATNAFSARVESSFRGREASRKVVFEGLEPHVDAKDLPDLIEQVQKLDRAIGGYLVVGRSEIKTSGFLGLGKESAMDKMKENLRQTVRGAGRAIDASKLAGDDLVNALCARAEALSDLGEAAKGMDDAETAVKKAPTSPRAWNCRANLNFSTGRFEAAIADYSRSLSLGYDAFEVYYRRGISRYYQGQFAQAVTDFEAAESIQSEAANRLYVGLWHAWTLRQQGMQLPPELLRLASDQPRGKWPRPALAMHAGLLSPEQVLAEVQKKTGDDQFMTLAEAWFYIGQFYKANGENDRAREAFQKAMAQGITVYIEHVGSGFELSQAKR